MTLDMGQEDTREYLAPNAPAVDFVSVLSHMIRSTSDNPAQLRGAIYELARIKLQKEGWRRDPPLSILEMRRLNLALETAIELVEAISSRRDELAVLRSLYRLIEGSNTECAVLTRGRDEWSPVIHQPPIVTNSPNRLPTFLTVAQRAPLSRIWRWFSTTLVLQGCLVAILSVILSVILDRQFDLFGVKTHPWAAVIAPTSQNNASAAPKPAPQASRSDVSAISSALTSAPQASQSAVPSASPEAKPVLQGTHPIISSQAPVLPLPDLYGVYAVSGAKLYELESLPGRVPDQKVFMSTLIKSASRVVLPEGKIVFVVYRRDMAAAAPDRMSVRVIAKVQQAMTFTTEGKASVATVDDQWTIRGISYEFRVAPVRENPEMLLVRSENNDFVFPAGRYGLVLKGQAYDFSVAGPIADAAQCLERTDAANGIFYSECRSH